uniref:Uncharacterized protein n=1 Tax=Anguilla anguilla TaxID=7936 RepID=A0A0E9WMX7_ANGAN
MTGILKNYLRVDVFQHKGFFPTCLLFLFLQFPGLRCFLYGRTYLPNAGGTLFVTAPIFLNICA